MGLFAASVNANAVPLRLDAASLETAFSSFSVIFDDTGDGLLQRDEITQFSGTIDSSDGSLYSLLVGVPTITDISTISGFCPLVDRWCFVSPEIGLLVAVSIDSFAYAISPGPVPEPGTFALLGLGLLGIRPVRRRSA